MAEGLHLPTAVGTLLVIDGAIHVAVGASSLFASRTLLPILLVLWGTVTVVGVALVAFGLVSERTAYQGGLLLVGVALVGYLDVQVVGASEALLGIEWQPLQGGHSHGSGNHTGHPHAHGSFGKSGNGGDSGFLSRLWAQLASDHLGFPSKIVEVVAGVLLVYQLRRT